MMKREHQPLPRYVSVRDVLDAIPISRPTLWRLVRDGLFPAPVAVSPGRTLFNADQVAEHMRRLEGEGAAAWRDPAR